MGKKWIALILALALLLALAACGGDAAEETTPEVPGGSGETVPETTPEKTEEENSDETGTETVPDSSEEEKNLPERMAVSVLTRRTEHRDDDGTLLLLEDLDLVQVTLPNSDATNAVLGVMDQLYQQRTAEAANLLEQARSDKAAAAEYGSEFNGYAATDQTETTRLDDTVLSLVLTENNFTGGVHGNASARAMNFDLATGRQLTLDDLTSDRAALEARLAGAIAAEIAADPDSYYPGAADQLDGLVTDDKWCFTDEGMAVLVDPYILAPFAAGVLRFTVPYDQLADLLDAKWLPQAHEPSDGTLDIALEGEPSLPTVVLGIPVDSDGTQMVLYAEGTVYDLRLRAVSSSDGVTWYAGSEYLAVNRLTEGEGVLIRAMLPDVMTNVMVTYTAADGSTAAWGILQSGKDGSVFLTELEDVIF